MTEQGERLAVAERTLDLYAETLAEMRREISETRKEISAMNRRVEEFVAESKPALDAFRAKQEASAKLMHAVTVKVLEWSVVGLLSYLALSAYDRLIGEAGHAQQEQHRTGDKR